MLFFCIEVTADSEVEKWYVRTKKTGQEEPVNCYFNKIKCKNRSYNFILMKIFLSSILVKSSPQSIETNRKNERLDSRYGSIRRNTGNKVNLKCIIEPKEVQEAVNKIQWTFSEDDQTFSNLPDGVAEGPGTNEISISQVKRNHRGYYRCSLNNISFTVLLRVKGSV